MVIIKKFIFLLLLLFFLLSRIVTASAENNSSIVVRNSIGLELVIEEIAIGQQSDYEIECGRYIKYFQSLIIYQIFKKSADTIKKKTCYEMNFANGYSKSGYSKPKTDYKLTGRLKVSSFNLYTEITLIGSAFRYNSRYYPIKYNLKCYPIKEEITFNLVIDIF